MAFDARLAELYLEEHGLPLHGLRAAVRAGRSASASEQRLVAAREFAGIAAFPFDHRLEVAAELTAPR